ncbi:MAG: hypothetical protein AB1486_16805 [Planctomycetota bacterium]
MASARRFPMKGRSPAMLVVALTLGVAGITIALGNQVTLLYAAVAGACVGLLMGGRLDVPLVLLPGLALSALAYLYLPAPVRELATAIRDRAAEGLGYAPSRLPLSFYGISFLPYVAACGLATRWISGRGLARHSSVLVGWTVCVAVALAVLSVVAGTDLRAPAAVLAAEGALLFGLGFFARRRGFVFSGVLGFLGGVGCGLRHLDLSMSQIVLVLSACSLVLLWVSVRLVKAAEVLRHEEPGGRAAFRSDAALVITDAVALGVLALALLFGLPAPLTLATTSWWDALAFVPLCTLLVLIAQAYRRPEPALLAMIGLARIAGGILLAAGVDEHGLWQPVACTAASALPLVLLRFGDSLRFAVTRPGLLVARTPSLLLPAGVLGLQFLGMAGPVLSQGEAFFRWRPEGAAGLFTWQIATALVAGPFILLATTLLTRRSWLTFIAMVELLVAGCVIGGTVGFDRERFGAIAGVATMALASSAIMAIAAKRQALAAIIARPAGLLLPFAVTGVTAWLLISWGASGTRTVAEGVLVALAGAAVAASSIGARLWPRRASPDGVVGELAGRLAAGLVAVGLLDAWRVSGHAPPWLASVYPLGLIGVAIVLMALPRYRSILLAAPLVQLSVALVVAVGTRAHDGTATWVVLTAQVLVAACGRVAARDSHLGAWGSLLLLLGFLAALSLGLADSLLDLETKWQPLILLAFATAALLAPRVGWLGVHRGASSGHGRVRDGGLCLVADGGRAAR